MKPLHVNLGMFFMEDIVIYHFSQPRALPQRNQFSGVPEAGASGSPSAEAPWWGIFNDEWRAPHTAAQVPLRLAEYCRLTPLAQT